LAKERNKKNKIFSNIINIICIFIALVLILFSLIIGVFFYFNSPVENHSRIFPSENDAITRSDNNSFLIDVRRGETSQSVGLRLERAGLIKNRYFWNIICRLDKEHIKTGTYRIELPVTPLSIHRLLVSGREILHSVTIPEGVTLRRTARILEEAGITSADAFMTAAKNPEIIKFYDIPNESMEGYLFPDTYLFPSAFPAERVVRAMADNFFNNLENISSSFNNMSRSELNDIVILASIVEREYRVPQEAAVMAGVFSNRLRINMLLQSCATVEYIITEIQGRPHPNVILYRDLEIQNPFNTYMYRGLPPGPISAPGVIALRAAVNPERTDYLYFRLIDPASGRHQFSRTYDAHLGAGQIIPKAPS